MNKKKVNFNKFQIISQFLLFLFILFLPTQFGKHFFLPFSYLSGVRVDYLAPTIYISDILFLCLVLFNLKKLIRFFINKYILILFGLIIINILFSQSIFISIYRYIKMIEFLSIGVIIYKQATSSILLFGFLGSAIYEFILVIFQFLYKHSIQGNFYFLGERYMTLSSPGIAKIAFNGIEFLRPYGTFSHPNSMAGYFLVLYILILTNKIFRIHTIARNILLFICTL
ncbi:MAG: hypothetical protein Q7R95_03875, partial [bacterium]|nr:hypothetical protein [bacterium]